MTGRNRHAAPALVVVSGPIASGKSTVSRALATALRERGDDVALVGLDEIAEMALPTLPSWETAHAIFASVVGQWMRSALSCVIAEGPSTPEELSEVLAHLPSGAAVTLVGLTSPFDVALSRAQADSTRGISRDPDFLGGVYRAWVDVRPRMPCDVEIDTSRMSVEESLAAILTALER